MNPLPISVPPTSGGAGERSLRSERSGAVALEFALLLPMFLLLLFGILQIALLLLTQSVLDSTTAGAARLIRTGQIREGGETGFRQTLCRTFNSGLLNCDRLRWTVQSGASFAALEATMPVTSPGASVFAPGGSGQPAIVQLFYSQPLIVPFLAGASTPEGGVELMAAVPIRIEDFQ